ncbi:LacI family DNA-binding transcriptional regulator [Halobacillus halophilus]|uniref:LacI family DNA-binding transcriptional regulator n=1 Tax=Halobacillus halophilus TaxID=1570 RepID=UPI00136B1AA8|nr:LacI family DNA-binding transcriptional regulator [Halobacillus halophilus]MYL30961.1 LacI family DNA-binding transcriptional regulator [Halobacillus halophilus]
MDVTIKDVAKAAGVAPSTVSRVIADNPRISPATKRKVKRAMEEMGYHPNVTARNLASRKTKALGVVLPFSADKALQNPFFPEVLRGISSIAHDMDYSLVLCTGETDEEMLEGVQRMVYSSQTDGILLLYSQVRDPIQSFLLEQKFPFVVVGRPAENGSEVTHVDNDNIQASKDITSHLLDIGHERVAFIGGSRELVVTLDRLQGYERALQQAGISSSESYKVHTEFLKSGGRSAVRELMSLSEPPTGLVVADDLMAIGVISTLEEAGIHVPEDLSIVSFNNVYLAQVSRPALTTVDVHIHDLGKEAAACLIAHVQRRDQPAKRVIIPHKIEYRSSAISRPAPSEV